MTAYAVAMAEVQEDSVLCGSDACLDWDQAVDAADDFMMANQLITEPAVKLATKKED